MKSSIIKLSALAGISLFCSAIARAQTVELIVLIRGAEMQHTDATTVSPIDWDLPYYFEAGMIGVEGGSFSTLSISAPSGESGELEPEEDEYYGEDAFETEQELINSVVAGTYTFSGTGSSIGNFSFGVELPEYEALTPKKIVNFDQLQEADATKPITIEWESFSDAGDIGFIEVNVGYSTGNGNYMSDIWEATGTRTDGFPGMTADTTSVTIPAGTLQGSENGIYDVWVEFYSLEPAPDVAAFPEADVYVVTETNTSFRINTLPVEQPVPLFGVWPIDNHGYSNTQGWLGWLHVEHFPWAYSYSLGQFVYISEQSFDAPSGGWVYVPRLADGQSETETGNSDGETGGIESAEDVQSDDGGPIGSAL